MRILVVHRYYWPDTPPYAVLLRRIVECWNNDGHAVEVLSSQPSYKEGVRNQKLPRHEALDGVRVERLELPNEVGRPIIRIWNALRLGGWLLWRALIRRYDVIMISTAPPVLGGVFAALAAKLTGARFIYHCMDIHPEVGRVSGEFRNPLVYKVLMMFDAWSCQNARPVVVLSSDMATTLRQRPGGEKLDIKVLNNFSLPADKNVPDELPFVLYPERLTVLFAGNIGRFQGLDSVVEAMGQLKERDDIEFVFMGEGVEKEKLQHKAGALGAHIRFVDHQPIEVAKCAMRYADVGYVSLTEGMYKYAYPSKTMTYLEQGCPLIVSVESQSELARDVSDKAYGYQVPPGDPDVLAKLLESLVGNRSDLAKMRGAARTKFEEDFSGDRVLREWSKLLN